MIDSCPTCGMPLILCLYGEIASCPSSTINGYKHLVWFFSHSVQQIGYYSDKNYALFDIESGTLSVYDKKSDAQIQFYLKGNDLSIERIIQLTNCFADSIAFI
jgi:hypothetical protein